MGILHQTAAVLLVLFTTICSAHFKGLQHIPHVGNVAIGRDITSSSTCGTKGPEQYCAQDPPAIKEQCSVCDNSDHQNSHSPSLMIDYGDSVHSLSRTWWQSESNISHVDIQLQLKEAFFFSHIIISFKSRRPAAMILHKSIDGGNSFQKLHYYASDCAREFGPVTDAPCTSEYSHPSPGEVLYQTNSSDNLTNLFITNLRIELLKLHPLTGAKDDEIQNPQVAVRRFYAIYNIEVLGWCFCNGLETNCSFSDKESTTPGMVPSQCSCDYNTTGRQCQDCLSLYNASPWRNGFSETYRGCPDKCNCSNNSDVCVYDGSRGVGVCVNCTGNTEGTNCQVCSNGYYKSGESCIACDCDESSTLPGSACSTETGDCTCRDNVEGSKCQQCKNGFFNLSSSNPSGCQACSCPSSLNCDKFTGRCPCSTNDTSCCPYDQYFNGSHCINCSCSINGSHQVCTETGQCVCKPGVGGRACDRCLTGYHSLSSSGCKPCSCNVDGSNDPSICDPETGKCSCLPGVEGDQCDRCPLHTLGPVRSGALTCVPCFCNGYSTTCRSSRGWYWSEASSRFGNESASQDWLARNSHSSIINGSLVATSTGNHLRIVFPSSFLSDKRTSYGQYLTLNVSLPPSSSNKMRFEMFTMIKHLPSTMKRILNATATIHRIPLIANGFMQRYFYFKPASETDLHKTLANIIWMRLEVEFGGDVPESDRHLRLYNVTLPYASNDLSSPHIMTPLTPAPVAEDCTCPHSRLGRTCDSCSSGYSLDPARGGEFAKCVRCHCFGLADTCDPVDNTCIDCRNNTTGTHCTECASGYYYRDFGTDECLPCSCPGGIDSRQWFAQSCKRRDSGSGFECQNCREGFKGERCEECQDGYHGNPLYQNGTCRLCHCTNNSAGGNNTCDSITAQCICDDGFTGRECEFCQLGYYGNALMHDCRKCECFPEGSQSSVCDIASGQCVCRSSSITGRGCNECISGYWNISNGCTECNCSVTGSTANSAGDCHKVSGQCECREGHTGRTCSECIDGYWNNNGTCIDCGCNTASTVPSICNKTTGECLCLPGVTGSKCDACLSEGNTGILPRCELCDECSTRWIEPINNLEESTLRAIERAKALNITNVTHTEISEGRDLVRPLLELLNDIEELLNSTDFHALLIKTNETHVSVRNVIRKLLALFERGEMIERMLQIDNASFTEQRSQAINIRNDLMKLCDLLANLTRERDSIELRPFDSYVNRMNEAFKSSNQSHETVTVTVASLLSESRQQLNQYLETEKIFLNTSKEVVRLLDILKQRLSQYQGFVYRADKSLCGSSKSQPLKDSLECGCYDNGDACKTGCGGIGCQTCGGGSCNGTISEVERALNISIKALEEARYLEKLIENDISLLQQANTTSSEGVAISKVAQELAQRELRNISLVLSSIRSFIMQIEAAMNASLLNISLIDELIRETQSLRLSKTPEEVLDLLHKINETIERFPDIGDKDELRIRAERALNNSIIAGLTASAMFSNLSVSLRSLEELRVSRDTVRNRLNQSKEDTVTIKSTINQTTVLYNMIERNISLLHERIRSLNNSFQATKKLFDINSRNLTRIQTLRNETTERVLRLKEAQAQNGMNVSSLQNQTSQKRMSANEDYLRAQRLRERMMKLRTKAHDQLLESRRLNNRKTCIISEQEKIRDDIKRISAELESLHRSIQTEIGRNTICMKELVTGKK